jgi:preprotein translocase subunit SecD
MIIVIMLISITGAGTFHPGKWHQQFKVRLGLDLSGGTEVVLQAETPKGHPPSSAEMNQAWSILQSRVNGTGSTGAQVQQQGSDLINVSVPGAGSQQVISLVSTTAQMRFRQVLLLEPYAGSSKASAPVFYGNASLVNSATMKLSGKLVCTPGKNGNVTDTWKATVGYTPQQASGTTAAARSCPATPPGASTSWTRRCSRAPT